MDSLEVEWVNIAFRCMCSQSPGQPPPQCLLWKRHTISSQIKQSALQQDTPWPGLGVLDPRADMEKFRRGQKVLWSGREDWKTKSYKASCGSLQNQLKPHVVASQSNVALYIIPAENLYTKPPQEGFDFGLKERNKTGPQVFAKVAISEGVTWKTFNLTII